MVNGAFSLSFGFPLMSKLELLVAPNINRKQKLREKLNRFLFVYRMPFNRADFALCGVLGLRRMISWHFIYGTMLRPLQDLNRALTPI